jgi:hypothetical protein
MCSLGFISMEESETNRPAGNHALKIFASYVASIVALIFSVLLILIAGTDLGVDQELIRNINKGTPVIAIGLSLLIHFLAKHDLLKVFTVYITILLFTFVAYLGTYFL